jgi:hypothetical protein
LPVPLRKKRINRGETVEEEERKADKKGKMEMEGKKREKVAAK